MFKKVLILAISLIAAYIIIKIIFALLMITFKIVSFLFTAIIIAVIGFAIYFLISKKFNR